jgi:predicted O-methyltransferase YrrM
LSRAYETEALQYPAEIDAFVEIIRDYKITSYLEVGAKFGGSLWKVAEVMRPRSRIVAVDLPGGTIKWPRSKESLEACCHRLSGMGHYCKIIWGDSTDKAVIDEVRRYGKFDLILIDANHTMPYLEKDWRNYGPLGRMVAFHDISWHRPLDWKETYSRIDVPAFWKIVKDEYHHREFKMDPTGRDNGIGLLWRE